MANFIIQRRACDFQADCDCKDFDGFVDFLVCPNRKEANKRAKEESEKDLESNFRVIKNIRGF